MKTKFIVTILAMACLVTALSVIFTSCHSKEDVVVLEGETMACVETSALWSIYVDTETKVCYFCRCSSAGISMTVMYNADGTPKLWSGEIK